MEAFEDILQITHKIIGCAMKVHSTLGSGFQELIYQRSLAIEMARQGLSYSQEHSMSIYYEKELVGTRRVDFLVEGGISVELKAISNLEDVHFAQAINYLEVYNLRVGLLINFGSKSLQFHRLTNKKFKIPTQTNNKSISGIPLNPKNPS